MPFALVSFLALIQPEPKTQINNNLVVKELFIDTEKRTITADDPLQLI